MAKVKELFDDLADFESLLADASSNADGKWEEDFVDGLQEKYEDFGKEMFLSEKQLDILERIAG